MAVYWVVTARRVKAAERTEPVVTRVVAYWLPLIAALLLLGGHPSGAYGMLGGRFVPRGTALEAVGAALCLAGSALAIWARYLLGTNWSGTVQLKRDHELIQRGPYRVVRHPIYTGLLLLFLGNALEVGEWRGLLAVAIVFASFWR
jgi:protein-S-isoprenylcysteine O-methyltransferase Ste14